MYEDGIMTKSLEASIGADCRCSTHCVRTLPDLVGIYSRRQEDNRRCPHHVGNPGRPDFYERSGR